MIAPITMETLLSWSLLSMLTITVAGVPYGSINDYYDTNYDYEYGDDQIREEVINTRTPRFLSQPLDIVVNEGQEVRLPCLVDRLEGFVLLWRKNDRIISVGDQIIYKTESKIHIEESKNGNTLVIDNVDDSDEADFSCSISAYRETEIHHNVKVRVEPVIITYPQKPLTLREGDSAKLSCRLLSGRPIPDLKWRKCEGYFPSGEKEIFEDVIEFESVTRDDSGCYTCKADNGFAEEPVTSMAMLIVEYPPNVHIQKSEDSTDEMTITCTVESQPAANVTWLKDGETIEDETKRIKSDNKHTLTLGPDTSGNYTCLAVNKHGAGQARTRISGHAASENHMVNSEEKEKNVEDQRSFDQFQSEYPAINEKTVFIKREPYSQDF